MSVTIENTLDSFSVISASTLLSGLLAYWKFEEASGTTYDATANDVDLTPNNSPTYQQTGKSNYGIRYNNTNAGFSTTSYSLLNPTSDKYTVSFWINLNVLPSVAVRDYAVYRGNLNATPWENILSRVNSANNLITFRFTGASDSNYSYSGSALTISTWYHVVCIMRGAGTTPIVYLNNSGNAGATSQVGNPYAANNSYWFGNSWASGGENCDGIIDEMGIWNRALTSGEVAELYNSGTGKFYPF